MGATTFSMRQLQFQQKNEKCADYEKAHQQQQSMERMKAADEGARQQVRVEDGVLKVWQRTR